MRTAPNPRVPWAFYGGPQVMDRLMDLAPLYLKKREEKRLRNGHPWLFSNEVDVGRSPLKSYAPGQPVQIRTHGEEIIGCGYINPKSLICVRVLSRDPEAVIDAEFIGQRVRQAVASREQIYDAPFYRAIYGEGDGLYHDVVKLAEEACGGKRKKSSARTFPATGVPSGGRKGPHSFSGPVSRIPRGRF